MTTQTLPTLWEKVQAVNAMLAGGEPDNVSHDTFANRSGYKPQAIIDALNEVLGIGGWAFEEVHTDLTHKAGGEPELCISQVRLSLAGTDFQPTGWGQARVTKGDVGDARKGAQTDAIKKAASYFSIGNRAYLGQLDEDRPAPAQRRDGQQQQQPRQQPAGTQRPSQEQYAAIKKHRERLGWSTDELITNIGDPIKMTPEQAAEKINALAQLPTPQPAGAG